MSIEIGNPKKPRRLERKFRISKRDWKILAYRELDRFKKLSRTDQVKLNKVYAKVVMNGKLVCRHDARCTTTQYDILKGYTIVTHRCLDCHKILQTDIHITRG